VRQKPELLMGLDADVDRMLEQVELHGRFAQAHPENRRKRCGLKPDGDCIQRCKTLPCRYSRLSPRAENSGGKAMLPCFPPRQGLQLRCSCFRSQREKHARVWADSSRVFQRRDKGELACFPDFFTPDN
jgi:hypothetical protein